MCMISRLFLYPAGNRLWDEDNNKAECNCCAHVIFSTDCFADCATVRSWADHENGKLSRWFIERERESSSRTRVRRTIVFSRFVCSRPRAPRLSPVCFFFFRPIRTINWRLKLCVAQSENISMGKRTARTATRWLTCVHRRRDSRLLRNVLLPQTFSARSRACFFLGPPRSQPKAIGRDSGPSCTCTIYAKAKFELSKRALVKAVLCSLFPIDFLTTLPSVGFLSDCNLRKDYCGNVLISNANGSQRAQRQFQKDTFIMYRGQIITLR